MSSRSDHPTAGRRRKFKSPATRAAWEDAVSRLQPTLPDHLRDCDGPSGSDDEKEAKPASTTPRSIRGTDPDDYDRVI